MKKSYLSLILILLINFSTGNLVCCGEDFFIDSTFVEAKNKMKIPVQNVARAVEKTKKKGLFSKQTIKTRFNYATNQEEEIPQGYYGTLPDIKSDFAYKKQAGPSSKEIDIKVPNEDELNEENFKPAPFDDDLFLDIIIGKTGDIRVLDEDELEEALSLGIITKDEFDFAVQIKDDLLKQIQEKSNKFIELDIQKYMG